ncbi:MAG: hypothetical protein CMI02_15965 [Oceanospirillaceae bacterium]|nr:hypothetical protein [Oceanospirillaceae bacterium]MBT13518.1 hypothetical protein [Oceanospirillaceae bacterium]|tara:strand:+ start:107564 stop:108001 length:438 start_codon:yes stop_codon:yes gene_type:complete
MSDHLRVQELRENLMELTERVGRRQAQFELAGNLFEGVLSQAKADKACRELDDYQTEYFENVRELTLIAIPHSDAYSRGAGQPDAAERMVHYSLIYSNERAVCDSALRSFQSAIVAYRQSVVNRRIQLFALAAVLFSSIALFTNG